MDDSELILRSGITLDLNSPTPVIPVLPSVLTSEPRVSAVQRCSSLLIWVRSPPPSQVTSLIFFSLNWSKLLKLYNWFLKAWLRLMNSSVVMSTKTLKWMVQLLISQFWEKLSICFLEFKNHIRKVYYEAVGGWYQLGTQLRPLYWYGVPAQLGSVNRSYYHLINLKT